MRKHLLPAIAEGDTIFLEHKSEIRGFVVQDAYFNPQTCTIFIIFFGSFGCIALGSAKAMSMWDA